MTKAKIDGLLYRLDRATALDPGLLLECAMVAREVFPNAKLQSNGAAETTESVLQMIDQCLPNWTIQLTGKASETDGHWHCTLRETRGHDEDEYIGIGKGPIVVLALLEALMRVALMKTSA